MLFARVVAGAGCVNHAFRAGCGTVGASPLGFALRGFCAAAPKKEKPRVYFDIEADGEKLGRVVIEVSIESTQVLVF
jgi:hypothetical protein